MIRQNRNQRRCSCPERLQNRQTEHRLIRRGKLKAQYTGESKTTTPVKPTMPKHLRRCNTPETLKCKYEQNPDHRLIHWQAPVQPVIRKILPEPRTNFSARHSWETRWSKGQIKSKSHQILKAWSQRTCEHIHGRNRRITPWFGRNGGITEQEQGFLKNAETSFRKSSWILGVLYWVKSDGFTTKSSEKYYDLMLHGHTNEN